MIAFVFLLAIVWLVCAFGAGWNYDNPLLALVLFAVSVAAGWYALALL